MNSISVTQAASQPTTMSAQSQIPRYSRSACSARRQSPVPPQTISGMMLTMAAMVMNARPADLRFSHTSEG